MNLSEDGLHVAHIAGLAGRFEPAQVRLESVLTVGVLLAQGFEYAFDTGGVVLPDAGQVDLGRVVVVVHNIKDSCGCDEMGENACNGECVVLKEEQTVSTKKKIVGSDGVEQVQASRLQTDEKTSL